MNLIDNSFVGEFYKFHGLDPEQSEDAQISEQTPDWVSKFSWDYSPKTQSLSFYYRVCLTRLDEQDLKLCQEEAQKASTPMGGGKLDYNDEQQALTLKKTYKKPIPLQQLDKELQELYQASLFWKDTGVTNALLSDLK